MLLLMPFVSNRHDRQIDRRLGRRSRLPGSVTYRYSHDEPGGAWSAETQPIPDPPAACLGHGPIYLASQLRCVGHIYGVRLLSDLPGDRAHLPTRIPHAKPGQQGCVQAA